jgi:hypothetical protein
VDYHAVAPWAALYQRPHKESSVKFHTPSILAIAFALSAIPALADDCSVAAKNAMLATAQKPVSTMTTMTSAQGKQSVSRTVQTQTNKYVQRENGEWYSMDIGIKDLIDDSKSTKVICKRSGTDMVNGQPATFYELQIDEEGINSEIKMWVSSQNLILKTEGNPGNLHYTTLYDSVHVTPPANAKRMGSN